MEVNEEQIHELHAQLVGYVASLYDEANKLSTKQPRDAASRLMIKQVNRVIGDVQRLVKEEGDPFVDDIQLFDLESAGQHFGPENRDVVLVLRQVKDALSRMEQRHRLRWMHLH